MTINLIEKVLPNEAEEGRESISILIGAVVGVGLEVEVGV